MNKKVQLNGTPEIKVKFKGVGIVHNSPIKLNIIRGTQIQWIILLIGFAYVWIKGDLDWVKMKLKYGAGRYANLKMENK